MILNKFFNKLHRPTTSVYCTDKFVDIHNTEFISVIKFISIYIGPIILAPFPVLKFIS